MRCPNILKTLNTKHARGPQKLPADSKLLSLVVIFTQSIQLSKIVCGNQRCNAARHWAGLETCSRISVRLAAETQSRAGFPDTEALFRPLASGENGGADRDRTDDILLAKQALSQLSYSPLRTIITDAKIMVGLDRFELSTSPLSGVRSSQLSYRPGRAAPSSSRQRTAKS